MTIQLGLRAISNIRDDHIEKNPVTTANERFILLEPPHVLTRHQVDHLVSGAGGSLSPLYNYFFAATGATNLYAPDGTNTAVAVGPDIVRTPNPYQKCTYQGLNSAYAGWPGPTAGDAFSLIAFVQAGGLTQVGVSANAVGSNTPTIFDLTTGNIVGSDPNGGVFSIIQYPGSWWAIIGSGITQPASPSENFTLWGAKAGSTSWNTSLTDTLNFWWGQAFQKFSAPPMPFTGAAPGLENAVANGFPYMDPISQGGDLLSIPLSAPISTPSSMTIYMEWLERGNAASSAASAICRLGDISNTPGSNGINITQNNTGITGVFTSGGSTSTSTVSLAPTRGQLVAMRATLNAGGALRILASINSGAEAAGSLGTAVGLPGTWSDTLIFPNALGGASFGIMALRKLSIFAGVQPLSIAKQ